MLDFDSIVSVISLIASIVSLIVAIYYAREQIKLSKHMDNYQRGVDLENKRFLKNEIESKAVAFINKYQVSDKFKSDILLINLCVMALKYDRTFYYRREIYREFCSLSKDVQLEILRRVGSDLDCDEDNDFYKNNLNLAIKYEAEFRDKYNEAEFRDKYNEAEFRDKYNDDERITIFYENGKYLERALTELGSEHLEDIDWKPSKDDKLLYEKWCLNISDGKLLIDHVSDVLCYDDQPYDQPLQHLYHVCDTNKGGVDTCHNYLWYYMSCWVSKLLSIGKSNESLNTGTYYYDDYRGDKYFEDLFLETMFDLYTSKS